MTTTTPRYHVVCTCGHTWTVPVDGDYATQSELMLCMACWVNGKAVYGRINGKAETEKK